MDLDTFSMAIFCRVDEAVPRVTHGQRLRQRGPQPTLADSEGITMEVVGAYLGREQDSALFASFRRHSAHCFPALRTLPRTTFVRQAAPLWRVKEQVWQEVAACVPHDEPVALIDSGALPVCLFARADRCRRFRGEAAYGKDHLTRQPISGSRVPVRLCWPGVITRVCLAPATVAELATVADLAAGTSGWLVGDRTSWKPALTAELRPYGLALLAPFRWAPRDPPPGFATLVSRLRSRIDTVFGQLVARCAVKRVWAHDPWHLWSRLRLLRKILMHTLAVLLNWQRGNPPLQLARLVV
jgi:Transposase DDE domain